MADQDVQLAAEDYTGSRPLYFVAYSTADGRYLLADTGEAEAFDAGHWTSYAVALAADAAGDFGADLPADAADGEYYVTIYERAGVSPAAGDHDLAEAVVLRRTSFAGGLLDDAADFIDEFAETVTVRLVDNAGTVTATVQRRAVVNRQPPAVIKEDGRVLSDHIELCIANDPDSGIDAVNPGRTQVLVSGRFGGTARAHVVTDIVSGDEGIWTLRLRGK